MGRPLATAALTATLSLGAAGCDLGPARPRPVPAFAIEMSASYAPAVVRFHDRSRNHPASWRWSFGDGTVSRVRNPVHRYTSPGTYVFSLRVTNEAGSETRSGRVHLSPAPRAVPRAEPEVLVGAGDIADCGDDADERTAALLAKVPGTVFTLGDEAYPSGTKRDFEECYAPSWGRFRKRTLPVPGNHEYESGTASAFFAFFGRRAGRPRGAYRSLDIGAWHVVLLDSNCGFVGGCRAGSAQISWLARDLEASRARCTLAMWHHPRFSSGAHSNNPETSQFWEYLYYAGAELVLNGHDHDYERFAAQDPSGTADPVHGLTEIVAGTGGKELRRIGRPRANSLVRDDNTYGVLRLTLHETSADWKFLPVAGQSFTDSGTVHCHDRPAAPPAPEAGFSSSASSGPSPLTVAFTDGSRGNPSAWDWDFGDGTRATSRNPLHTYSRPGRYRVRLTVSNPSGSDTVRPARYVTAGPPLPAGNYAHQVLARDPVGYWRLGTTSSTVRDFTGSAVRRAGGFRRIARGITRDRDGALLLDGRSGSVEVDDRDDLDVGSGDFSLEAWARPTTVRSPEGHVVVQKSAGGDFSGWQYRLALNSKHRWRGTVFVGSRPVTVTARRTARPAWTHLVLVRSGRLLLLYVDGVLVAHAPLAGRVNDGTGTFAIGKAGDGSVDWFDGAIDEVALYRSALSSAEISAHFRSAGP